MYALRPAAVLSRAALVGGIALLAACSPAPAAPTPAPTTPPAAAKPTEAPKPAAAAPTTAPAAKPTDAPKPAAASTAPSKPIDAPKPAPKAADAAVKPADKAGLAGFMDAIAASRSASYKVTYRVENTVDNQTTRGEQTWYVSPPNLRYDISSPDGPQAAAGTTSMFVLPDGVVMCTTTGNTPNCLRLPADAAQTENLAAEFSDSVRENPEQFATTATEVRTIAGQTASCVRLTPAAGTAEATFSESTYCISPQGVPLYIGGRGTNFQMTMEATAYSTSVSPADFQPPAVPTDLSKLVVPGIPSGVPGVPGSVPGMPAEGIPGMPPGGIPGVPPGSIPGVPSKP
jgi:hypothetical protein